MNGPQRYYLVVTDIVLNAPDTGYRGVFRTEPVSLLYAREDLALAFEFTKRSRADEQGRCLTLDAATEMACLSRDHGFSCEIIECIRMGKHGGAPKPTSSGDFLGYDVADTSGAAYSVLVDRCLHFWAERQRDEEEEGCITLDCIARYYNSILNEHRLFQNVDQAFEFLAVDRECAERFGGEMNCNPEVVAVYAVR